MQDVDLEVKQLRETLAEYNEEFRQVRNQGKKQLNFHIYFFFSYIQQSQTTWRRTVLFFPIFQPWWW